MKSSVAFGLCMTISSLSAAMDTHHHSEMMMSITQPDHSVHPPEIEVIQQHPTSEVTPTYDHRNEHGGQIYTSLVLDQQWRMHTNGDAEFTSKNELRIGTDENKWVAQLEVEKPESQQAEYDARLLYSRMIAEFWDIQAGVGYQKHSIDINNLEKSQEHVNAVFGIQGLAPYFFESSAYLSLGKEDYVALNLETERDFLLTQKWIAQPYIEIETVLNDHSKYAEKSGIREASIGLATRYEISKQFMPYLDIAYRYEQEIEWKNAEQKSHSDKDWIYSVGIKLMF